MKRFVVLAALLSSMGIVGTAQSTQTYRLAEIGTLGGDYSVGVAINDAGQVTGWSYTTGDVARHAFAYFNGSIVDLGTLGGSTSKGTAINGLGYVTGDADTPGDLARHAFLYHYGPLTDLGTLGGASSYAAAINSYAEITGAAAVPGESLHAFVYSNGTMTDLGTLGGSMSLGTAINRLGQVTGLANLAGDMAAHAFLYTNGGMEDLGTFSGGTFSIGAAINAAGEVTGYAQSGGLLGSTIRAFQYGEDGMRDLGTLGGSWSSGVALNNVTQVIGSSAVGANDEFHAFIYDNQTITDLGTLGGTYSRANSVNALGQVTGYSYTRNLQPHAFLYNNGQMFDLNDLIDAGDPLKPYVTLQNGIMITDSGRILAQGTDSLNGITSAYVLSATATPGSATVSWTTPTARTDGSPLTNLAGFNIYYGTSPGSYPNTIAVTDPGLTTYLVDGLAGGATYYFAMTAYDTNGIESAYSNAASKTMP